MIRYHLDDLGWYQFEWLIQSLLKATSGLAVESWGGHGDHGRDAYSKRPLRFPSDELTPGPILFQVKFVQNANAAGARIGSPLMTAVQTELARIIGRRNQRKWKKPKHYVLITNACLSGEIRIKLENKLQEAEYLSENVLILGGNDICDLLDQHENLRRSFPQLLSIRDLNELIHNAVSKEALERSRTAIEIAQEIVPVFVPTAPYSATWKILSRFHFVVLEGPPEMGKTAIAWMVGLALLTDGWQVLVCDSPKDFFSLYEPGSSQVFIADDAFGRTEYDPSRGVNWERSLERILGRVDSKHWFIWTTRKHILERALKSIDLQGKAINFPGANAVLVEADRLSTEEKALMLYRHARAAALEKQAKLIVKSNARLVVNDSSFTPERIRRFVVEVLPELAKDGEPDNETIISEIQIAIQTPTTRMKKSFRALGDHHKLLLTTLLEGGSYTSVDELKKMYESRSLTLQRSYPFEDMLDELSESFIKFY
jgi:hypothetical protein